jgi:flagellar hook assembly protein FlgD
MFSWSSSLGATKYQIEVHGPSSATVDVISTSHSVAVGPGSYTWRVRAYNSSGWSAWTSTRAFNVSQPPQEPTSTLSVRADSPVNILVIAPDGSRIGYDPAINEPINDIPGATYTGPRTEPQIITIPNPLQGDYNISVFGTGTGNYRVTVESSANGTTIDNLTFNGTISEGGMENYQIALHENYDLVSISNAVPSYFWIIIAATAATIGVTSLLNYAHVRKKSESEQPSSKITKDKSEPEHTSSKVRKDASGTTVQNWTGKSDSFTFVWDGKDGGDKTAPDGTYNVVISGANLAGNALAPGSKQVAVDIKLPAVTGISIYPTSFMPSIGQTTKLSYTLSENCHVTVRVHKGDDSLIATLVNNASQSSGPRSVTWNGKTSSGSMVPAGTYTVKLYVTDRAGNKAATYPITSTVTIR